MNLLCEPEKTAGDDLGTLPGNRKLEPPLGWPLARGEGVARRRLHLELRSRPMQRAPATNLFRIPGTTAADLFSTFSSRATKVNKAAVLSEYILAALTLKTWLRAQPPHPPTYLPPTYHIWDQSVRIW